MTKLNHKVRFSTTQPREAIDWWLIRNTSGPWSVQQDYHAFDRSQSEYIASFEAAPDCERFSREFLGAVAARPSMWRAWFQKLMSPKKLS